MSSFTNEIYELRNLTKKVNIQSRFLQADIHKSLLRQVKMQYQSKCIPEGYVEPDSIRIINYSLGRVNYLKGGVDYHVTFQASVCLPHVKQHFKVPITIRSKIGLHAELQPMKFLIPRDLHIGNKQYEDIELGDTVEVEVIGSQFKQGDEEIVVVAKLVTVEDEPEQEEETNIEETENIVQSGSGDEKQVVFVPVIPDKKSA